MALEKLRPDGDLQCFFLHPSAIAALSATSANGFTVSGTWRQQFDWAVIEWNRDNVYEHPLLRNLPDGDLSGLTLTYEETRTNCIPMDSDLFRTVSWPFLRVWAPDDTGTEQVYHVPLRPLATPIAGSYTNASADFTLTGTVTAGDIAGIAYLDYHFTIVMAGWETLTYVQDAIVSAINTGNGGAVTPLMTASRSGNTIHIEYIGAVGANGNRWPLYTYAMSASGGASTMSWDATSKTFSGGTSPTKWSVTLDFSSLQGYWDPDYTTLHDVVHPEKIRKLRWTYAADLQTGAYTRSEFQVQVSNWAVTGTNRAYAVAGTGSRRIEDHSPEVAYSGSWSALGGMTRGNYSGGTIHRTTTVGDSVSCTYRAAQTHTLHLGTRYTGSGADLSIDVDGSPAGAPSLQAGGEDVLTRYPVGQFGAGSHTITVTHNGGPAGAEFFFDFFEAAVPSASLPSFPDEPKMTLATDWDTDHSLALAPERTARLLDALGFKGRANHYVGALWFYELVRDGHMYAAGSVTFHMSPYVDTGHTYSLTVTLGGTTVLTKLIHVGDSEDSLALAYANELNRGYMSFRAVASGNVLTIYARAMGVEGNAITITASTTYTGLTLDTADFAGGVDGDWHTDLSATPRLNRAVRDWSTSFFAALHGYGIDVAAALSMELQHGDDSVAAGIAQRAPTGDPILLPTPSLQTNFSPTSLAFWQEAYAEIAGLQTAAGLQPFLQFGEVQWWYLTTNGLPAADPQFRDFHGMPFYDAWTATEFLAQYGRPITVFTTNDSNPASFPDEAAFLPAVLGNFTTAVMTYVRSSQPACRFEVLFPGDVNHTSFNQTINFPAAWTPASLEVLKTESFGFTFGRDLNQAEGTVRASHGFPAAQRSHLVGIGDSTASWLKEVRSAAGKNFESVVLFALDQFCLIGYAVPLPKLLRRSLRMSA